MYTSSSRRCCSARAASRDYGSETDLRLAGSTQVGDDLGASFALQCSNSTASNRVYSLNRSVGSRGWLIV